MSKGLSQLLGKQSHEVSYVLQKLEGLSGYNSLDNQLMSEIRSKLWPKVAELGLDAADTTPDELYHAIIARFKADNDYFHNLVGNRNVGNPDLANKTLTEIVSTFGFQGDTWSLKRKSAKDILSANQPKKLMKYLNYRSMPSMLKRENIGEIYAALPLIESEAWKNKFYKDHLKLKTSDFEVRRVDIVNMPEARWKIIKPTPNVTKVNILGDVILWPNQSFHKDYLSTFVKLIVAVENVEINNLTLMDAQVRPDFPKKLEDYLTKSQTSLLITSAFSLGWHNIAHYYNGLPASVNSFISEPHMQDIKLRKLSPAKLLADMHPLFRWWEGNEYIGVNSTYNPVSLNISDAADNVVKSNENFTASFKHLKHTLWNELLARYMAHPQVEAAVVELVKDGQDSLQVPKEDQNTPVNYRKLFQTA